MALKVKQPAKPARDDAGRYAKPQEDEALTMLKARCRIVGTDPESREARDEAKAVQHVDDVGRCLIYYHHGRRIDEGEKARLWTTWQGLCTADRAYAIRYLGQTGTPKGMALTLAPEPMQADEGHTVDLRTADEKDADAKERRRLWDVRLGRIEPHARALIVDALRGGGRALYHHGSPTEAGRATISALVALADVAQS